MDLKRSILIFSLVLFISSIYANSVVDSIYFGHLNSEKKHRLSVDLGEIIIGESGLSARKLLAPEEASWRGGRITFRLAVDPQKTNYITTKFWGGDVNNEETRLMLFIDGKQVGQRHLGEIDQLDIMCSYPRNPQNFFYKTLPLPLHMTKGKKSVELAIEAQGPVWGYGGTFDKFQKPIKEASRGIYAAYIHTAPYLKLHEDVDKHALWSDLSTPSSPGIEVLDQVKEKINKAITKYLQGKDQIPSDALLFLAKAYLVDWSVAHNNSAVLDKIVKAFNIHYAQFNADNEIVGKTWEGYGSMGYAISLLAEPLKPYFEKNVAHANIRCREAWTEMLVASRDWHVQHRRSYTNQSMIVDMFIYRCNRGIAVLMPENAWPEEKALRLLYESVGLEPWSGSWTVAGDPSWSKGKSFMQLTEKGLTKELGYVGLYGEVNDIVLGMYNSTRPVPDAEGDPKLKAQLLKIAKARTFFRYPMVNEDGERTMRIETVIGWRDWHYPGAIAYDQIASRDGGPLEIAAATLDPVMLGYGQQIIEDKQYFKTLKERAKGKRPSELLSLMDAPASYAKVIKQAKQNYRLPMTPGQPDFVFADPEEGAVAIKNGDEILYVSLYYRARYAINHLSRIHFLAPHFEYDATVHTHTEFDSSGLYYTIPDLTNAPFTNKLERAYKEEGMYLARAGQKQAIAMVPKDQLGYEPGKENMYAGKGNFYMMQYGSYLIAMNCTKDIDYSLDVPAKFQGSVNLVQEVKVDDNQLIVKPLQTVVLYAK